MEGVSGEEVTEVAASNVFEEALRAHREAINERFYQARRSGRGVDGQAFLEVLQDVVAPVIEAVAQIEEGRVDEVLDVLVSTSLRLLYAGILGPQRRHDGVQTLWRTGLEAVAARMVEDPRRVVVALSNAAHHLAAHQSASADRWMRGLAEVAPQCEDADELLAAGQVLAWRCGLASLRPGALEVHAGLREPLQSLTVGVIGLTGDELHQALHDRWWRPGEEPGPGPRQVARVGGFRGVRGPFLVPPQVVAVDDELVALQGDHAWKIWADAFGQELRRFPLDPRHHRLQAGSAKQLAELQRLDSAFEGAVSSCAVTTHTAALTLKHSHFIFLATGHRL